MLNRVRASWRAAALVTFNALVVVCAVNLLAWPVLLLLPDDSEPRLDSKAMLEAYPGRTEAEIRRIQSETWGRPYVYEPFTQFKEGPVSGEFVTVDTTGFRRPTDTQPWPPNPNRLNVFVFGGSTAFGYGVADSETIPASLENHLRDGGCEATVYNLARSNYFSTQERVLFEQLLLLGHAPAAAVFVNGLNEFMTPDGNPKFTRRISYLMAEDRGQLVSRSLKQMPLVRLARAIVGSPDQRSASRDPAELDRAAREILTRWRRNHDLIRAVAQARQIPVLFVWQPVPGVDNAARAPSAEGADELPNLALLRRGYAIQDGRAAELNLLWLANRPVSPAGGEYVDRVHYSAAFSSALAQAIAQELLPTACPAGGAGSGIPSG